MIETTDLILRQGSPDDWKDLYQNLWRQESAFQFMFTKACSTEEAAMKKTAAYTEMQKEVKTEFFVYEKASDQCIGIAGIKELSPHECTVTDIAIGPAFWGKGYGKQILHALEALAVDAYHARTLYYACFDGNFPSQRLAESCGFVYTHSAEAELRKNGEEVIMNFYQKSGKK